MASSTSSKTKGGAKGLEALQKEEQKIISFLGRKRRKARDIEPVR